MKKLNTRDYEALKKLIKQMQAHKSAWPFMEPVDATEAPDYYKVIKEPIGKCRENNLIQNFSTRSAACSSWQPISIHHFSTAKFKQRP